MAVEIEEDGLASLERRLQGEVVERAQLAELALENRPARLHEPPPLTSCDPLRVETCPQPLDELVLPRLRASGGTRRRHRSRRVPP